MDPERFRRLMDLVGSALERPEGERDAWLAEECGTDAELLAEARSLLAYAPETSPESLTERLEAGVADAASRMTGGRAPVPERIGPYQILEVLGEGGMGIVYGAQEESPLRREVAVKVLRVGVHGPRFVARFESERTTLASLDHPNIAHIFEAGTTEEGLLYFTMEWVRGEPITDHCDSRRLAVPERLRLFQQVLSGVQHAHQKAVVHRDLKPSNVLVADAGGEPIAKVIDFGVARVTAPEPGVSTAHTAVGAVLGTLEYMSPEQATGAAAGVDTRSDIYSLGVLLYELLAGRLPFASDRLREASPGEMERLLHETEPPSPSRSVIIGQDTARERARVRGTGPDRLARALRGDLDNIVGKAMRKDPGRRYASAAEFHDDIQRYLEGRPVTARPATLGYRTRRFVGRHRVGVLGTAAALLLVVGMTAAFTMRLAVERDRAQLEAETAGQVAAFLQQLFEAPDPSESLGEEVTVRELLDDGALAVQEGLAGQPEVQARMMRAMGSAYQGLGLYDHARPLLEGSLERHRFLHGDDHEEVAASQAALAVLLGEMGELDAAEALHRAALATRRSLLGAEHPLVSQSLSGLARVLERGGDISGAEALYEEALAQAERLHAPDGPEVAAIQVQLGGMLRLHGRFSEAEPLLRAGLAAQRAHYGDRHPRLASAVRHLAALLRDVGHYGEAEALYLEALAHRRAMLGDEHPTVATTLSSYALLLQRMGDGEGAIAALSESVQIMERAYTEPHPNLAHAYHNLAIQLSIAGRYDEASEWHARAAQVQEQVLPEDHGDRAHPVLGLAWIAMEEGRYADAEPLFRQALAIREAAFPPGHRDIGGTLSDLGAALTSQDRYEEAEATLLEAYEILVAAEGAEGRRATRAAGRLAQLYDAWDRPEEAAPYRP